MAGGEEGADGGIGGPAGRGDFSGAAVKEWVGEEVGEVGEDVVEDEVGFGVERVQMTSAGLGGQAGGPRVWAVRKPEHVGAGNDVGMGTGP